MDKKFEFSGNEFSRFLALNEDPISFNFLAKQLSP